MGSKKRTSSPPIGHGRKAGAVSGETNSSRGARGGLNAHWVAHWESGVYLGKGVPCCRPSPEMSQLHVRRLQSELAEFESGNGPSGVHLEEIEDLRW